MNFSLILKMEEMSLLSI